MEPTKLIATYARVSTARQEEEHTIQSQVLLLKEESQKKNYTIVKEYADDGWSGDILARPSLDQLRADAKLKLFQAVLIYDPDRLARRYSYQELIMDELKEAGIEVIFITVSTPKNSEDKILHGVRGLFAEYERAKISERFRIGKLRKVKEGHILTTEALYGYKYIKKQEKVHGYYEINQDEAKVVKMIFTWVADEGLTVRKVIRRLQELAIKPRKSKRGVWSTSTLSTMLAHRAYIGEAHYGKSYAVIPENPLKNDKYKKMKKSSRKVRPEEDWHIIPVPAILDKELFARARARIKANFELCQRNQKNEYLLANKIWCTCGKRRSGEGPQHGKHLYYRCNDRVQCFPLPAICKEKGINARIADSLVWEKVTSLMCSPELMNEQVIRWQNGLKKKIVTSVDDIDVLEKEIDKLIAQEDRYNKVYGAGLFTLEKLKEYINPIRERITAINTQIAAKKIEKIENNDILTPNQNDIVAFATTSIQTLNNLNFTTKRAIILEVIDKVVGTKEEIQVYGHIPVKKNVEFIPDYRNRQDTTRHDNIEIPFTINLKLPVANWHRRKSHSINRSHLVS